MYLKGLTCQTCHGSVAQVAQSIANGREPWLQEPSCGAVTCHGSNYAEQPGKLFRQSRGHGSLFCSACHGSPHAIYSTREANDNLQNIMLQALREHYAHARCVMGIHQPHRGPMACCPAPSKRSQGPGHLLQNCSTTFRIPSAPPPLFLSGCTLPLKWI
jgi:hypothetical protein